jgi:hypothetical protein
MEFYVALGKLESVCVSTNPAQNEQLSDLIREHQLIWGIGRSNQSIKSPIFYFAKV